jgi:hypothetical protein
LRSKASAAAPSSRIVVEPNNRFNEPVDEGGGIDILAQFVAKTELNIVEPVPSSPPSISS